MALTRTVTGVALAVIGGTSCWVVALANEDGSQHLHAFPVDTMTWRAAEYDIDPADVDTLLDIVLHEPYIPDPAVFDPPAAAALRSSQDGAAPVTLANARSRAEARTAHLARVQHAKATRMRIVTPRTVAGVEGGDPLDIIRRCIADPVRVREIHDRVNGIRPPEPPIDESAANRHNDPHGTA